MFPFESFLAAHIQQQCPGVLWAISEAGPEQRICGYAFHFHGTTTTVDTATKAAVVVAAGVGPRSGAIASTALVQQVARDNLNSFYELLSTCVESTLLLGMITLFPCF